MINTTAINLVNPEKMMVTWDVGRRCNFDCTYCEVSRHDNVSPPHSYDELKTTFNFIKEWTSLYNSKRNDNIGTNINFTGGEPTVNPALWTLAEWINENEPSFSLGLTTNGAWHPKNTDRIAKLFKGVTVSYHAEAHPTLKEQTKTNIKLLHEKGIWLQVNVMLHMDYFDECVELCNELKSLGIKHNPRPIGDGNFEKTGWFKDSDGSMRRTSHPYTEEQQEWFFSYLGIPNPNKKELQGTELGRACCGGRCLKGKVNGEWQDVKLVNTNFKNWHCSVDWFFLHIDQHTGLVYHHQTCQALHGQKRGALGNLNNSQEMIDSLKLRLNNKAFDPIICPNNRCGCGMCVPKAQEEKDFKEIFLKIRADISA